MLRNLLGWWLTLAALCLIACGGRTGTAAKMPDGSPIAIMVHTDRGLTPETPADRAEQINQLASWMENDLLSILEGTGYAATRIDDPGAAAGPGRYVLRVKIKNYNAGSKAARMMVGFGAGAAVLDTHFELIGEGGAAMIEGDPSVGSGRDWRNSARKVNQQTVDAVNARLHQR